MKSRFIILFLFCSRIVFAQQSAVRGMITSESTGEKLFGVLVMPDGKAGTISDTNGIYKILLPEGSHQIIFKLLGFEPKMENVIVTSSEPKTINILLRPSAKELGVVVVSAGRFEQKLEDVTVSMNVIKPELIQNSNTTNMEDIMGQIPGVNVTDGQMSIRGGSGWSYGAGSRVLVLVDDIPILSGDANDVKWNFIPVENLEQVEVIKGASSALFGSSALNGVMNIRTAYPKETPITKVTLYTGVYDTPKRKELKWWGDNYQMTSGYSIFHSEQFGQNDIVAGANYFNDDGFRQGEDEQRFRINANYRHRFKKISGLAFGLKSNVMQTHMGTFFIWANDSTGALTPLGGMDTSTTTISVGNTTRFSLDPFFNYVKNNGTSHKLNTRYFVTINKNNTSQQSTARFYFGEYQFQKRVKDILTFTLGATDSYTDVSSQLYGNHTGNNFAVFAQSDIKYKKISFSLGARMEKSRLDTADDDFKPVVRTGINYHLLKETYLRASYGQGYRFPSVAEKYISTQISSVKIFPNDSLKPETGWSAELGIMQGIKIVDLKGYIDVAVFQTEYKEMVEFLFGHYGPTVPPTYGFGFQSQNIGDTRIKGIDISLSGTGNVDVIEINLLVGYTYIDPHQTNFDIAADTSRNSLNTNVLKYRYRHLFKGDIECTIKKVSAGLSVRYNSFMQNIDRLFNDGIETLLPSVKSYREKHDTGDTVFDFRISYQMLASLKTAFIVKNLFNHEYVGRPYDMQPPRSFTLQFSLSL